MHAHARSCINLSAYLFLAVTLAFTIAPHSEAQVAPVSNKSKAKPKKPQAGAIEPKAQDQPVAAPQMVGASRLVTIETSTIKPTSADKSLYVNGKLYSKGEAVPVAALPPGLTKLWILTEGPGCHQSQPKADQERVTMPDIPASAEAGINNNIAVPELKFVDQNWIQQKLTATAQAIASLSAFSGTPITSQFGVNQGLVTQNSFVSAQAGSAQALTSPIPAAPSAGTTPTLPTNFGSSPLDVLAQQVELNGQLMLYQAAYNGFASDNLVVAADGKVNGVRRQVTVAIPVSVSPMGPYRGAVAEVRVVLIPRSGSSGHLSVVNLLPSTNSYNVAKITTDTKQLSAGATIEAVSLGVTAGKQKSALFLAKDMDTVSFQYPNPSVQRDPDLSRQFGHGFRNLLPTGECPTTGSGWATLKNSLAKYDLDRAIVFGWQFRPVLGDENVRSGPKLVLAQIALDNGEDGAPEAFVETRWRSYDKKSGIVGAIYRDSCTWKALADAAPLTFPAQILDVQSDDLGGGTIRLKTQGVFTDPNLQVRIGSSQRPPDSRSADGTSLEIVSTAAALLNAPNIDLVGSYGNTSPLVIPAKLGLSCGVDGLTVREFPNADGTATLNVEIIYGKDRSPETIAKPIVLLGNTAYGLRDNPYLDWHTDNVAGVQHGHIVLTAKTDDLKAIPSLLLRDIEWTSIPVSAALVKDPTFSSLAAVDKSGTSSGKTISAGWYYVSGTNVDQVSNIDCKNPPKPCASFLNSADPSKDIQLASDHLRVVNATTLLLRVDADTPAPLMLLWKDGTGTSTWSLAPKVDSTDSKVAADPAQLQKGDSRVVHFTGTDFSTVTGVKFEDTDLLITSTDSDKKGISVLVPTKATGSPGIKQLVAKRSTGDPLILTVTVVIP
jgi:hypothetical protein